LFNEEDVTLSLKEAFVLSDDDFLKLAREDEIADGSTALVALFYQSVPKGELTMSVAHCGDSRGVMGENYTQNEWRTFIHVAFLFTILKFRSAISFQLRPMVQLYDCLDHKPCRPDEMARLRQANGHVAEIQGVWRVFTPTPVKLGNRVLQVKSETLF
jgi:hypothetical protein